MLVAGGNCHRRFFRAELVGNRRYSGPEVDSYFAYWVEAYELPETEVPTTLVFERGTDGNVYLDGRQVSITVLT